MSTDQLNKPTPPVVEVIEQEVPTPEPQPEVAEEVQSVEDTQVEDSQEEAVPEKQDELEAMKRRINLDLAERAVTVTTNFMQPEVWKQIGIMAKAFWQARALPSSIQNEYQLIMVMQAGLEMGMKPIESIKSLYIVNGIITIYAEALTRRLNEWGFSVEYIDEDDKCTAIITHPSSNKEIKETYTFKQAEDSGYTLDGKNRLKVGWKKGENRLVKLRYGAMRRAIKTRIAFVLGSASDVKEVAEDYPVLEEATNKTHSFPNMIPTGTGRRSLKETVLEEATNKTHSFPNMIPTGTGRRSLKETVESAAEVQTVESVATEEAA